MRAHPVEAGTTMREIALRAGFTHPVRFSMAYLEALGEHPSRTLAR